MAQWSVGHFIIKSAYQMYIKIKIKMVNIIHFALKWCRITIELYNNPLAVLYTHFILYLPKWQVLHRSYSPKLTVTHPIMAVNVYGAGSIDFN